MSRASRSGSAVSRAGLALAIAVSLAAGPAWANGGSMKAKPSKDFRELIVKGERPEIAACMVAAIDFARHDPDYNAIRWDEKASDQAVMNETETAGKLKRFVRLTAQMRRGSGLFSETWQPVEISCEQSEDGTLQVQVNPTVG